MKSLVYICSLSCPLEGKLCESRDLVVSSKYLLGGLMSEWYHFHLSLHTASIWCVCPVESLRIQALIQKIPGLVRALPGLGVEGM